MHCLSFQLVVCVCISAFFECIFPVTLFAPTCFMPDQLGLNVCQASKTNEKQNQLAQSSINWYNVLTVDMTLASVLTQDIRICPHLPVAFPQKEQQQPCLVGYFRHIYRRSSKIVNWLTQLKLTQTSVFSIKINGQLRSVCTFHKLNCVP